MTLVTLLSEAAGYGHGRTVQSAERDAILEAFGDAGDAVVLSRDVHIGLAMDLPRDRHDDR